MAASCVRSIRSSEGAAPPFDVHPVTVQVGDDVGIAIYGPSTLAGVGYCVESNFGDWDIGGPGQPTSPDARPVEVVTSGLGLDDEVWALVRVSPSTTSIGVSLSHGAATTLLLHDGFAVLSFTNGTVGPKRRWPAPPTLVFRLGTVTGFNRQGLITGSDVVTVCYVAPAFCGGALTLRPPH